MSDGQVCAKRRRCAPAQAQSFWAAEARVQAALQAAVACLQALGAHTFP